MPHTEPDFNVSTVDLDDLLAGPNITRFVKGGFEVERRTDGRGRQCGSCTLCCRLVPVVELAKGAGERCQHQRAGKGCAIYHRAAEGFPRSCLRWSCGWLTNADVAEAGIPRPDHAHYVIDPVIETIRVRPSLEDEEVPWPAIQVWVDPAYPEARREPRLLAFLDRMARQVGFLAIVRWNASDAMVMIAPSLTKTDAWREMDSGWTVGPTALGRAASALEERAAARRQPLDDRHRARPWMPVEAPR